MSDADAAVLFPATAKATAEAFGALINAGEQQTPAARAAALSNSVLATAYVQTGLAARSSRAEEPPEPSENNNNNMSEEMSELADKVERNKLREESMERVENAVANWDARPEAVESPQQLQNVKDAVASWVVAGEAREERSQRVSQLLREIEAWLYRTTQLDMKPRGSPEEAFRIKVLVSMLSRPPGLVSFASRRASLDTSPLLPLGRLALACAGRTGGS